MAKLVFRRHAPKTCCWSGRSQAVRLPKEYRLEGKMVHISREGRKLILEPIEEDGWAWLDRLEPLDQDAVTAALARPGSEADLLDDDVRFD